MSRLNNHIFVVGDSQVRAYSYSSHFIPLFIGPAAFNNFLTEKRAKHTTGKLLELVQILPPKSTLLLTFSGDVTHLVKDTFKLRNNNINNSKEILNQAFNRYKNMVESLVANFNGQLAICHPYPGKTEEHTEFALFYRKRMMDFCAKKEEVVFVDIWNQITERDRITDFYMIDKSHVSYQISEVVKNTLESKNIFTPCDVNIRGFAWSYLYEIPTKTHGIFKIWGDFPKENLRLNSFETHFWNRYHKKTILQKRCLKEIIKIVPKLLKKKYNIDILVVDCQEGFLAFETRLALDNHSIKAIDLDEENILRAKKLTYLYKKDDIHFKKMADPLSIGSTKTSITICFSRANWKDEYKLQFFIDLIEKTQSLFFFSYRVKSDIRLLKKAGFKFFEVMNIGDKKNTKADGVILALSSIQKKESFLPDNIDSYDNSFNILKKAKNYIYKKTS